MVYNRRASDMHIGLLRPAQGVNLILEKDGERKKEIKSFSSFFLTLAHD